MSASILCLTTMRYKSNSMTEWTMLKLVTGNPKYESCDIVSFMQRFLQAYSQLSRLIAIGLTLPITDVICEPGLSGYNSVKINNHWNVQEHTYSLFNCSWCLTLYVIYFTVPHSLFYGQKISQLLSGGTPWPPPPLENGHSCVNVTTTTPWPALQYPPHLPQVMVSQCFLHAKGSFTLFPTEKAACSS